MSHGIDERYKVYNERRVKARKAHACGACGDPIEPGHEYTLVFIVFDRARSLKRCLRCQALHVHLRGVCAPHEMWPDERLDCGMDYEEEWGELPEEIAALAFKTGADMQESAR